MKGRGRYAVRLLQHGIVVDESRFFLHRTAKGYAFWQSLTAIGGHPFTTPLPEGMPPLWDVELVDLRGRRTT